MYESDIALRSMLKEREQAYVLVVRSNHHLRFVDPAGLIETTPVEVADGPDGDAWSAHAAGEGSKGLRLYHWAQFALPWNCPSGWRRWLPRAGDAGS